MFDTDLSRIGEIFYPEVGGEENTELNNFINYAFKVYNSKYSSATLRRPKQIVFTGDKKKSKLALIIVPAYDELLLSGFQICSETNRFRDLLGLLRGKLEAEFSNLSIGELEEDLQKEIRENKYGNCSHAYNFEICFSEDPRTPNIVKGLKLERCEGLLIKKYVPVNLKEVDLDKDALHLLSLADKINLAASFYADKKPHGDLIHESCVILQPEKGKYYFTYFAESANKQRIPIDKVKGGEIFEFVKNTFSKAAFRRIELLDPREVLSTGTGFYD